MEDGVTFKTSSGKNPNTWWLTVVDAARPTEADALYALEMQKTRILDRTAAGVDVDGRAFAPYNTTTPYYWYPGAGTKNRLANRTRAFNKQAGEKGLSSFDVSGDLVKPSFGRRARAFLYSEDLTQRAEKTGVGIKYSSYAAFKQALGRTFVDLTGPRAPHMLQAIVARVRQAGAGVELVLGIYGDEAVRAKAHNNGTKHLPRRHFFGASKSDIAEMTKDLMRALTSRVKQKL